MDSDLSNTANISPVALGSDTHDTLGFQLPTICAYHSRLVCVGGRSYLIWSPNSLQDPFYPGVFPPLDPVPRAADRAQRRYNGYSGPADFRRAPQAYRASKPWLGFITRKTQCLNSDVEYVAAYSVWEDPSEGHQFNCDLENQVAQLHSRVENRCFKLTCDRPRYPASNRPFELLRQVQTYEDAVDSLVEMSQWLREKQAWVTIATIVSRDDLPAPTRDDVILDAYDQYLGVWINGADEEDCLWLLTRQLIWSG
ncbi:hypothetical protein K438DRAFT_1787192 [Mycena galopus ATCC 62051]|nr:hypothetical protein K438DRAFT_1787192 [Mycena galopus ATCC 62051]